MRGILLWGAPVWPEEHHVENAEEAQSCNKWPPRGHHAFLHHWIFHGRQLHKESQEASHKITLQMSETAFLNLKLPCYHPKASRQRI